MEKIKITLKPLLISAVIFVLSVTFAVAMGLSLRGCDSTPPVPDKKYSTKDYTYMIDISEFEDILNTTDEKYLMLVNKKNPLGETYEPEGIESVNPIGTQGDGYTLYGKTVELETATAAAARALIDEMRAQGFDEIFITSGYRSYDRQKSLFDNYVYDEWLKDNTLTLEQCEAKVLEYSAYPGTSEHQSGLCVDFITLDMKTDLVNYSEENTKGGVGFAETQEFEWLKENAHKFGFILRYHDGKQDITGYAYESWHYRFVGIDAATKIYNSGLTLEEWLGK